ncbi:MAG: peptidyl-prolyl cis-trans isomerase [Acidobacteria bacterium]|nr:peptidyl-prolyl cis-trans isomerase [Acidobacteriota bacterium]
MRLKLISTALVAFAVVLSLVAPAMAQEGEARVIDEVVAQVNNDVITLSMIKREMKEAVTTLQQQGKSEQEATAEVTRRQAELIANLINEQLLLQQGKELGLSDDVEAEVNQRMLAVAKQQGIKTIEELRKAMKESGFDYDAVRQTLRNELMKQAVFTRDVDYKLFYGWSEKELKDYYNAHKEKFKKPESVTLSEIFLSLAGKNEADVKAKAEQLIAQARGGADFAKLASANSERLVDGKPIAAENGGKVGTFQLSDLLENIANAIKDVKAGGVTEPIRYDEGYQIIRVDERIAGSNESTYNENRVREALTAERSEKARNDYMETLRKDAYIKISESYRAAVTPFLGAGATPAASNTTTTQTPAASAEQSSDKRGNKP